MHPYMFDSNALLAYAIQCGRQDELLESGCFDLYQLFPLGQTHIGLWKLLSSSIFRDFCQHMLARLDHTILQGRVGGS